MRFYLLLPLLLMLLAGCGRIPEPIGYKFTNQQKMQAGHHWEVLAADLANEINNHLILSDYLNTPVFVRETCGDDNSPCSPLETTAFNEAFRDLLITHLVRLGVPTAAAPAGEAITVNYKAQTVYHHKKRLRTLQPGLITALTTGIVVLRDAPANLVAMVTAGAIDFSNAAFASGGNYEVLITTSMIARGAYLYRSSDIYYINDEDSWHYQVPAKAAEIGLTASVATPPAVVAVAAVAATPVPTVVVPPAEAPALETPTLVEQGPPVQEIIEEPRPLFPSPIRLD